MVVDRYPIVGEVTIANGDFAAVIGDLIIYENANVGLFYYNYKTGEKTVVCEGQVAKWETLGDGISFTKYISATSVETLFFDFNTKQTSHLSDNTVSVIDAVWFSIEE